MTHNNEYEIIEGNSKDWLVSEFTTSLHIKGCLLPTAQQHILTIPNRIDGKNVDFVSAKGFSLGEDKCVGGTYDDPDYEYEYVDNPDIWKVRFADGIKGIGPAIFECCSRLEEVILPKGLESIEENTFFGCKSLKNIELPSTLTRIGSDAFAESGIETLIVPGSVETITSHSLSNTNCKTIILSEGVKKIESSAFFNNPNLQSIIFPKSLVSIDEKCFEGSYFDTYFMEPFIPGNITLFCYPGTIGFIFAKTHGFNVENAGF